MKSGRSLLGIALVAILGLVANAKAGSVLLGTFTYGDGDGRQAAASFYNKDGKLEISLTNMSDPTAVKDGSYVLNSLSFNLTGSPTLSYSSATAAATVTGFTGGAGVNQATMGPAASEKSNWALSSPADINFGFGVGTVGGALRNGILPLGSEFPTIDDGTQGKVPFATPSITFIFCLPADYDLTKDKLGRWVDFGFGSATGPAAGPAAGTTVPLPAAVWSGLSLLAGLGVVARVKRKRAS